MKRLYNLVSCLFFLLLICSPIYFRCTYDGTLKDLLVYFRPKQPKKMFYQKLAIPIHELENKKQIKCTYLSTDQVRLQLIFYLKVAESQKVFRLWSHCQKKVPSLAAAEQKI